MGRVGRPARHGRAVHDRRAIRPLGGPGRRRLHRLRWAVRHPTDVLERSGFGLVQSACILLFVAPVVGWLTYTYFTYLS